MEKDLLKLEEEYEKNNDFEKINYFSENEFSKFRKLYYNKLCKSLFKERNAKEFVKHLDIVLKYTNFKNMEWLRYENVINQNNFTDSLATNLKHFPFREHIDDIFNVLSISLKNKNIDIFTDKTIEELLDLRLDSYVYNNIFQRATKKQRLKFLKLSLDKKVALDFIIFNTYEGEMEFIKDNIVEFATFSNDLFHLREFVEDDFSCLERLNNYIDNNPKQVVTSIINTTFRSSNDNINKESLSELLCLIIDDIKDSEKIRYSDIKYINKGGFSSVFMIGDKVLKLGKDRQSSSFPNNPYIIKPLLRKNIKIDSEDLFIEVTEKCSTNTSNKTEEDLYNLYKNIRDLGLVWTDVDFRNVGVLLKDNDIYWKDEINPSDKVLELDTFRGDAKLKKGDLVILDADFIFDENDPNIIEPDNCYKKVPFEERYQKEKASKELEVMLEEKKDSSIKNINK